MGSQVSTTFGAAEGFSGFAAPDLDAAERFYGETLGLAVTRTEMMLDLEIAPEVQVLIYPKPDHVPSSDTVLNFAVEDIDAAVRTLHHRGVEFLHYDGFGQEDSGIARGAGGGPDIAWFTDPAGNILAVLQRPEHPQSAV